MFKNLKISKKLILAFAAAVVISSLSGIAGVVLLNQVDNNYSEALENYGFAQGKLGRIGMQINAGGAYVRDIVFLADKALMDEANQKLQAASTEVNSLIEQTRSTNIGDDAKARFAKLEADLATYRDVRIKVVDLGMINNQTAAYELWVGQGVQLLNTVTKDLEDLMALNNSVGTALSEDLTKTSNVTIGVMIGGIVLAFAVSMILASGTAKVISRPIVEAEHAAKQMAQGNLNINIHADTTDEVGTMITSFGQATTMMRNYIADLSNVLAELSKGNFTVETTQDFKGDFVVIKTSIDGIIASLSDTLNQINESSNQVSSGSEQVASGAQALSQGATEQASSLQELAASINEVTSQIKLNANNAGNASQRVNMVGTEIETSNTKMQELISAMSDISNSSREIGKIIKTIEDIAFQTNILALNAAVEAARAGSAGKGFAVVADEVRNLATKSSEAAKNTTALIENSIKSVENGTSLAGATANSLQQVVQGAVVVVELINEISDACASQATSSAQITIGVEQISAVVQTNSATAEESAAASEELSGQAAMLKSLVNRFTLKNSAAYRFEGAATTDFNQEQYSAYTDYDFSSKY